MTQRPELPPAFAYPLQKQNSRGPETVTIRTRDAESVKKRLICEFMDLLVLDYIETFGEVGAYKLIHAIHASHDFLISSGTLYTNLYRMTRKGIATVKLINDTQVYDATPKGRALVQSVREAPDLCQVLMSIRCRKRGD